MCLSGVFASQLQGRLDHQSRRPFLLSRRSSFSPAFSSFGCIFEFLYTVSRFVLYTFHPMGDMMLAQYLLLMQSFAARFIHLSPI